jgi:hypothetical protein
MPNAQHSMQYIGLMAKGKRPMTASEMGKKGAAARFKSLTPEQRSAIARKAAKTRWNAKKRSTKKPRQ